MDLGLSGLASGFDWKSLVNQLSDVERAPQKRLRSDQSHIENRNQAYGSVKTQLNVLKNRLDNLSSDSVLQARKASVSDTSILTATAASGVSTGTYELNITQLATASKTLGTSGVGGNLYPTNTVDSGSLSTKGFSPAISAGTITVDGCVADWHTRGMLTRAHLPTASHFDVLSLFGVKRWTRRVAD
jgi:flagellar hook-associated protein 2